MQQIWYASRQRPPGSSPPGPLHHGTTIPTATNPAPIATTGPQSAKLKRVKEKKPSLKDDKTDTGVPSGVTLAPAPTDNQPPRTTPTTTNRSPHHPPCFPRIHPPRNFGSEKATSCPGITPAPTQRQHWPTDPPHLHETPGRRSPGRARRLPSLKPETLEKKEGGAACHQVPALEKQMRLVCLVRIRNAWAALGGVQLEGRF